MLALGLGGVTALMMSRKSADFNERPQRGIRPRRVWQTIPPHWRACLSLRIGCGRHQPRFDHSVLRGRPEGRHGPLGHPRGGGQPVPMAHTGS